LLFRYTRLNQTYLRLAVNLFARLDEQQLTVRQQRSAQMAQRCSGWKLHELVTLQRLTTLAASQKAANNIVRHGCYARTDSPQ